MTEALQKRADTLKAQGTEPCIALLRVGERPDDLAYERAAIKRCEKIGIRVMQITLDADCTQDALLDAIARINADDAIHGCLMFRPLPKHLDEKTICEALKPEKDMDGPEQKSPWHGSSFNFSHFNEVPDTAHSLFR